MRLPGHNVKFFKWLHAVGVYLVKTAFQALLTGFPHSDNMTGSMYYCPCSHDYEITIVQYTLFPPLVTC